MIGQCDIKHSIMFELQIKTITSVLKVSTYIITSITITVRTVRLSATCITSEIQNVKYWSIKYDSLTCSTMEKVVVIFTCESMKHCHRKEL